MIEFSVTLIMTLLSSDEDECTKCDMRIKEAGRVMMQEDIKLDLIHLVQGELFCNMEGAWWNVEECQQEWEWLMPKMVDTLANWFTQDTWTMEFCSSNMGC